MNPTVAGIGDVMATDIRDEPMLRLLLAAFGSSGYSSADRPALTSAALPCTRSTRVHVGYGNSYLRMGESLTHSCQATQIAAKQWQKLVANLDVF